MEQHGRRFLKSILLFFLSFFGLGLISKKMPGTIGSFYATLVSIIFVDSNLLNFFWIAAFIVGIVSSHYFIVVKHFEDNRDPGYVVIDEACGIFLGASILKNLGFISLNQLLLNFVLFRIFDIFKPFPIRNIENFLKQSDHTVAFGIMLDDMLAAICATTIQIFILKMFDL